MCRKIQRRALLFISLVVISCQHNPNAPDEPKPDDRIQQIIQDYEYRRFTYFFIDTLYREQFRRYAQKWVHTYVPNRVIDQIDIYKSAPGYDQKPEQIPGVAYPALPQDSLDEAYRGNFIRLDPNIDYYVEKILGYLVMANAFSDEEVLAVAFKTVDGKIVGDINYMPDPDPTKRNPINLRLIKTRSPIPSLSTWNLEWKNVYSLGARNIPAEDFQIKIFFKPASGNPQEFLLNPQGGGLPVSYLNVFGLDERNATGALLPDDKIDLDPTIVDLGRGELIFPDLTPFNPAGVIVNGALVPSKLPPEKRTTRLYDTRIRSEIEADSKFYIEVKYKRVVKNIS